MIRIFLIAFLLFILTGCSGKIPGDVLPEKTMMEVKWDLMQADEMVEYYRALDTTFPVEARRKELYAQVMKIHGIDQEKFDRSLDFYTANPELLNELLDSIQNRAEQLPAVADQAPTQKLIPDSIALEDNNEGALPKKSVDTVRLNKFLKRRRD